MSETVRILLMEADGLIRHSLAEYLRECGYSVAEATNVEEARQLLTSPTAPVDMLFSRGETGFAAAKLARELQPGLEVVLGGSLASTAACAQDLCEKGPEEEPPYDHKYLLDQIKRFIARRG